MGAVDEADLVVGVDTHLDTHTAAICDARGRAVVQLQVPATTAGYAQLLARVRAEAGAGRGIWAVEGTRHYGLGLARHLASAGEQVTEIASVTASSTAPSTPSPSPACAATRQPGPTSSADAPTERPTGKSAAASSATSPATSTAPSPMAASATLDKHRSVMRSHSVRYRPPVSRTARSRGRSCSATAD